jgi:hypothetical protein
MKVYLKQLDISDWKGIKKESFTFTSNESYFLGSNGTGKTSVFASFIWLLLGIDNFDRADHQIKPLKNGEPEHRLDSQVSGTLVLDGTHELRLRRVLHEEWVKPKTKEDEVFKGNTTLFYINDVGVQKKEYDAKVGEFCPPFVFKAVSNPHYFTSLTRDEQRKMLFSMVDNVTDGQIAAGNPVFEAMLKEIAGVTLAQFKKSLAAKKNLIQKDIDDIVPRIAELKRNEPEKKDWQLIEVAKVAAQASLTEIDGQLTDESKKAAAAGSVRLDYQIEINQLVGANKEIENIEQAKRTELLETIKSTIRAISTQINNKQSDGIAKQTRKSYLTFEIEKLKQERAKLLTEYAAVNAEKLEFHEGSFDCPTCHRPLDIDDIEKKQLEMAEAFNQTKAGKIEANVTKGKGMKVQIELLEKEVAEIGEVATEDVSELSSQVDKLTKEKATLEATPVPFRNHPDFIKNEARINELRTLLEDKTNTPMDNELNDRKRKLNAQIQALTIELASRETIENTVTRIEELTVQKKKLNQEKATLESKEYVISQFEDAKSTEFELRINKLFRLVQFRLFKKQVDGQTVPDCECMLDGVLYSTLNNAAQINAGLDIIRAISKHFNFYAPIFIDNRESVVDIPEMECQVINLVVDKSYPKLTYISEYGEINEHLN